MPVLASRCPFEFTFPSFIPLRKPAILVLPDGWACQPQTSIRSFDIKRHTKAAIYHRYWWERRLHTLDDQHTQSLCDLWMQSNASQQLSTNAQASRDRILMPLLIPISGTSSCHNQLELEKDKVAVTVQWWHFRNIPGNMQTVSALMHRIKKHALQVMVLVNIYTIIDSSTFINLVCNFSGRNCSKCGAFLWLDTEALIVHANAPIVLKTATDRGKRGT